LKTITICLTLTPLLFIYNETISGSTHHGYTTLTVSFLGMIENMENVSDHLRNTEPNGEECGKKDPESCLGAEERRRR
tara:strand:+ start:56 stop:289 length:234 start_codon:yes stop_codon:yes gene_type:complete